MYIAIIILLSILGLWLLGNLTTYPLQHLFIFRPIRHKADFKFNFEVDFEEVWFEGYKGGKIHGIHFKTDPAIRKGAVLYFHGNSSSVDAWGEVYHDFLPQGWDLLLVDYRGFGKSKGKRSEQILYLDAHIVWTWLKKEFPAENIIIYGRSLGTSIASNLATHVQPRKLILETPFFSMVDLFYTYYPVFPKAFIFRYVLSNGKHLEEIAAPVIIFHGTKDKTVPYKCGVRLKKYMKEMDEFVTIFDGGHNDLGKYEVYRNHLAEALR